MLRLTAADEADLAVISAQIQDALLKREDLNFDQKRRRFALVTNRFAWDALPKSERRRAGLHFDDVESVQSAGLPASGRDAVLSLLAVTFAPVAKKDPAGIITLMFSGGMAIKLKVACINATLTDLGGAWATQHIPAHGE
ncbi:DUF2948 family protein [Aestuariivirga litoralis]|uniref:DUF2948 family protein n=1 Tax=Aestuariivirga litoralis TaxID=2650924 RepID=UPI0018C7112D|nr:DUF2948 family protein [Aestuariivirga litoralis]MBG1232737.1 DUF2948 family protein [Aestuariivirga litoralis]